MTKPTFHRFAALALFCACIVSALSASVEIIQSFRKSPVAEAAIVMVTTLETCVHHTEGCPKNCHCPKILVPIKSGEESAEESGEESAEESGEESAEESANAEAGELAGEEPATESDSPVATLNEPQWVTCNDAGTSSIAPAFALFLAEPSFELSPFASNGRTRIHAEAPPRAVSPAPPQKIPIA